MFKENQTTTESKTVIGASVNVEGDFKGQGDVVVEGRLKGSLATEHDITIGGKAKVNASVAANNVYISGKVKGNIEANGHVQLSQSAEVVGNILATTLAVETGATLNGQCITKKVDPKAVEEVPDPKEEKAK